METITCKECNHVNEAQRVYCHECGARLDRAALVEEASKPKKAAKSKKASAAGRAVGSLIGGFFKTTFLAALAACLVQALRAPDGVPHGADLGAVIVDAPSLSIDLENAAARPTRLVYSEPALNEYLKNRLKPSKGGVIPASVWHFEVAFVQFGKENLRLTKQYRLFNFPIYLGGVFHPQMTPAGFHPQTESGRIGRLPIAGRLFSQVDRWLFADLIKGLDEERKGLDKMKEIRVNPKAVEVISG